ncbi:MAG: cation:proton antiporter [Bacteroidota bacterium]|nr:cation:proton antiporter [Bacteroidota bacterium]
MIELASILVLSVLAQWLAWKIKVPAILPLILIGLALGPFSTFFTSDGEKLMDGDNIFSGDFLFSFVSISVGVILFEGGLTLKLKEIRHQAGVVRNLLIVGPILTLGIGGVAAHYFMETSWPISFLFGALIIVSGPTVIMPILRNVKPRESINTVLKWEGILIDPLGALVAVLVYEFIRSGSPGENYTLEAFKDFFMTIASGVFIGGISALFLRWVLDKNRLPNYLRNVVVLGMVIFGFTFSEFLHHEAGLMAATVMGIFLANLKVDDLKSILSFKEDVSIILISVLFLLLSSRIDMEQIQSLGIRSLWLFGVVILIIRPLVVWLSTLNSNLDWREKSFLAWIGPKGIVAAAVASLFSLQLMDRATTPQMMEEAELLLPLTFLIIVGTVVLQGSTAKPLAKLLKVERDNPKGILVAGAHEAARLIAQFLKKRDIPVQLIDTSATNVREAQNEGITVFQGNILSEDIFDDVDMAPYGRLMAMTSNTEVNNLTCKFFDDEFGENRVWRLMSKTESEMKDFEVPKNVLFNGRSDFDTLIQAARQNREMHIEPCNNQEQWESLLKKNKQRLIPIFRLKENGKVEVITRYVPDFEKGDKLAFLPYTVIQPENLN